MPSVPDGPEVGHCGVLPRFGEEGVLHQLSHVLPLSEIPGSEQVVNANRVQPTVTVLEGSRYRVIAVVLFPDTWVEDTVPAVTRPLIGARNDRIVGVLCPVHQQGIGRRRDRVPRLRPMVDRDYPIWLDQSLAAEAVPLHVRVQRHRQIAPVDEVVADGMTPVNAIDPHRPELVEHVVPTLPLAQPVGVVHVVLR